MPGVNLPDIRPGGYSIHLDTVKYLQVFQLGSILVKLCGLLASVTYSLREAV
jgi:hypothetical protein